MSTLETIENPRRSSSSRSCFEYSGPRVPTWQLAVRSIRPSSLARRKGVPCVMGAPKYVSHVSRCASEEGLIDLTASCHVGTRGPLYSKQDLDDDERLGFSIVSSVDIEERGIEAAIERVRRRVGDRPLYISIDIDVLDPAHAPGTGTPEAGGMTSRELLRMLRALSDLDVVGADVVEVSPAYDHAQLTGIAASHVVYELVTLMAARIGAGRGGGAEG